MKPLSTLRFTSVDPRGGDAMGLLRKAAIEAWALYPELSTPGAPSGCGIARGMFDGF